jgi:hypothetical protein
MPITDADRRAGLLKALQNGIFINAPEAHLLGLIFGVAGATILEDCKSLGGTISGSPRY